MKFESKFGIGEIVIREFRKGSELLGDDFYEVIAIVFSKESINYACRHHNGLVHQFMEYELIGDPDFNQETGKYPEENDSVHQ